MQKEDMEAVRSLHAFDFPLPGLDSPLVESAFVVTGEDGAIEMAGIAVRTTEVVFVCDRRSKRHPLTKLAGIRILHEAMRDKLLASGQGEAYAFVAPEVEKSFGRHLQRHFGWLKCWSAYCWRKGGIHA